MELPGLGNKTAAQELGNGSVFQNACCAGLRARAGPSTHISCPVNTYNSSAKGSKVCVWPLQAPANTCAPVHICTINVLNLNTVYLVLVRVGWVLRCHSVYVEVKGQLWELVSRWASFSRAFNLACVSIRESWGDGCLVAYAED